MANDLVSDNDLSAVLQISADTQEQAVKLVEYMSQAGSDGCSSPQTQAEISKQLKIINTNLSQLRGLHRVVNHRARDTKSVTAEARQEVDRLHLQLQNLYYEQRHLQGEIAACESYEHSYQKLPLIPIEEFLALFPEHADSDETTLTVARIEHERAERETLDQQRQELLKRKIKLVAENKKRREDLANLDKDLEKFIDAAKPIQKIFEKVP